MRGGGGGWLDNVHLPFSDDWVIVSVFFVFWWAGTMNVKEVKYCTYVEFFEGSIFFWEKWIHVCRKCRLY